MKIRKLEESYQEILRKENDSNEMDTEETEERIPLTKDLTDIIERISKTKGVQKKQLKEQNLVFQKIPKSNVAVFQNIESDVNKTDTMKAEVNVIYVKVLLVWVVNALYTYKYLLHNHSKLSVVF